MKVLIFGCGPAGLMAAHAAALLKHDVIILSKARKSHMRGAQYLHAPIPGATAGEPFDVTYSLRGSVAAYREKIYGAGYRGPVSPEELTEPHAAWDIRQTYGWLWETYGRFVKNTDLGAPGRIGEALLWSMPDVIISTIPAPILCDDGEHQFRQEEIWSNDLDVTEVPDNTVICNGEKSPAWYRASRIQGYTTVEWPKWSRPPMEIHNVVKPLTTNCICLPDVHRMGRYGLWTKGVLSHSAFDQTIELLRQPHQTVLPL